MSATLLDNYDALKQKQTELIRKALDGSVFVSEIGGDTIASITSGATSQLLELPDTYHDLGYLSTDGAQFSRDVSTSDSTSWGSQSPTRSDINADTDTLTIVPQETNAYTLGLASGRAADALTLDAVTGELIIKKPSRPSSKFYRVLTLAVDQGDDGEIYVARFLPRAKVTGFPDFALGGGDDPISWGVTFTGYVDAAYGSASSFLFGGPGWKALGVKMGFAVTP